MRFGQAMTALFVAVTTGESCGAVNAMHDSLTPLGGLAPLFLIQLGEVLPGGVGSGLYGLLVFAILTVFIAGLMVGRTPEFLGKKIEIREMKFAMLAVLILPLAVLAFTAVSAMLPLGARQSRQRRTAWPQRTALRLFVGGRQQWFGLRRPQRQHAMVQHDARHRDDGWPLRLCRAGDGDRRIAGGEDQGAESAGTFPTDKALFVCLLVGVILIVGGLQYFPALALGPIVEHFLMLAGKTF